MPFRIYRAVCYLMVVLMVHIIFAQAIYAQSSRFAANDKVTPHEPHFIIPEEKGAAEKAEEKSWFSKYKWWLLAGIVIIGGAAAASGGGGGGGSSSEGNGGSGSDTGNISINWSLP